MFKLKTIDPKEAAGKVAEIYGMSPPEVGVPNPLLLSSASPALLEIQAGMIGYYTNHKTLNFHLLTAIRYLMAAANGYDYCIDFNGKLLMGGGMSPEDLEKMRETPGDAPFEPKENALLAFVNEVVGKRQPADETAIDSLREMGWTDSDIYDALAHAASVIPPAVLYKALLK